jgi:TonB family protein
LIRAATWEEMYVPNKWGPTFTAVAFHAMLLAWNPLIMPGASLRPEIPMMTVEYRESLPPPPVVQPKPIPPPPPKKEKKIMKKSRHAAIASSRHMTHPVVRRPKIAPKPFVSRIALPKFVPHTSEDIVAASPAPGISAPAPHPMTQALATPHLKTKSRGIRASDINFELTDKSSLSANTHIVAIPIGEERGEVAALPNAQVLHDAPLSHKTLPGYRFKPGAGMGSGELTGRDRKLGYHGVIQTDEYVSGSLSGTSGKAGRTQIGQGFEIGGPVGDRKIAHRKLPEYPDWAEEKGISAVVVIFFTVKPDGSMRNSMRIERSSGYPELDQLAKDALMQWRFSPTSSESSDEAWGRITFRFTLK